MNTKNFQTIIFILFFILIIFNLKNCSDNRTIKKDIIKNRIEMSDNRSIYYQTSQDLHKLISNDISNIILLNKYQEISKEKLINRLDSGQRVTKEYLDKLTKQHKENEERTKIILDKINE